MDVDHPSVNTARSYDSSRRRKQASLRHSQLLDGALQLFIGQGFAATSIESIAQSAGMAAATIYKSYGGKPGLVRALCDRALAGEGPVPAEQRSNELQRDHSDARTVIEGWGRLVAEVSPRLAPILLLMRDAAIGDADAASLYDELDQQRLKRMAANARRMCTQTGARPGLRLSEVRDVLWLYSSPEMFDLLVRRRKWSVRRYSAFVTDAMIGALVDHPGGHSRASS